jgi:hypothetical protein
VLVGLASAAALTFEYRPPYLAAMRTFDRDESVKLAERFEIATDPVTSAADLPGHRDVQKDVDRANRTFARAGQAVRGPRPRSQPGRRRAHADHEAQARLSATSTSDMFAELYDHGRAPGSEHPGQS